MGIEGPQSRRARIICSISFHRSIILTIGRLIFLGFGGLWAAWLTGLAFPNIQARIHYVYTDSLCIQGLSTGFLSPVTFLYLLMFAHLGGFCATSVKNHSLNRCPFPRLVFLVIVLVLLVWLPVLLSSTLFFLCSHPFFFIYFDGILWAFQECLCFLAVLAKCSDI
jgi:hypothetical protein